MPNIYRLFFAFLLCINLAACGGGGSESSGLNTPDNYFDEEIDTSPAPGSVTLPDDPREPNLGNAPRPDPLPSEDPDSPIVNGGNTSPPPEPEAEPTNLTVSVQLSWTAPERRKNGGNLATWEIANYEIYVYDEYGDFDIFTTSGANTEWIRALEPGTYQIAMLAIDTDGLRSDMTAAIETLITR